MQRENGSEVDILCPRCGKLIRVHISDNEVRAISSERYTNKSDTQKTADGKNRAAVFFFIVMAEYLIKAGQKSFLTMRAKNRTSAAENNAPQRRSACGAGLAALSVYLKIGRIAVVSAFAQRIFLETDRVFLNKEV